MQIDVNEFISEEIKKINLNEIFKNELESQIRLTVQKALKDSLGTWSPLSKALDEHLKNNLNIDLSNHTLAQYSTFVIENCHSVIQELMSEERAKVIQKHFRDKMVPHLVKVVNFGELWDAIVDTLKEVIKSENEDGCNCSDLKFKIVCKPEEKKYHGDYWSLIIYEGEEENHSSELAALFISDTKCYHSRGKRRDEFTKRFASYVFNNTMIEHLEEETQVITYEDLL